jgi:thiol-disulfide isomerase/thioredoxin
MLPMLEEMAVELEGKAEIVKFNCNKQNKELGQSLGIKVAPTFHLYRDNKQVRSMPARWFPCTWGCSAHRVGIIIGCGSWVVGGMQVAMMTGAKIDELKELVSKHL